MRLSTRTRLMSTLAIFAVGACSDSAMAPVAPTSLDRALAEMSLSSLVAGGFSFGSPVLLRSVSPATCAYNGAVQSLVCAPIVMSGLTINTSYALLTATGAELAAFDAAATAAIRTTTTVAGTMGTGPSALTIDEREVMTLSGLLTGQHLLDGSQLSHITGSSSGQPIDETITTIIAALVPPDRAGAYPHSGTVTSTLSGASFGTPTSGAYTITMKFNGTSKVDVTITGLGPARHCVIDLAATSAVGPGCG